MALEFDDKRFKELKQTNGFYTAKQMVRNEAMETALFDVRYDDDLTTDDRIKLLCDIIETLQECD